LFTTFAYAALLLAAFVAYWTLPEQGAWPALLLASLIFYAAWSVPFLVLLVASILVGYASSHTIARTSGTATDGPSGRRVLALTVFVLLGPLAFFKYSNLVLEAVAGATGRRLAPLALALPLGISFYTFQILAYVIDVSRGASPEPSLLRFALFVLFWRRWHITLSTWLRDYLYIPLGGNRVSPSRTRINLLVTMTLGGLWHGASLTFILWGFYHGVLLTVSRAVVGRQEPTDGMRR